MRLEDLRASLPDYAKDLRLNLSNVLRSTVLDEQKLWGTVLASAVAAGQPDLVRAAGAEARERLSETAVEAAHAAAAVMGMNNVYYRFVHLVGDPAYGDLPARLRMQVIASPGVDGVDFELWCLAVSAIHGCGRCMASHEQALRAKGATPELVQEAVRVAAVVHGVAGVLAAEKARAQAAA